MSEDDSEDIPAFDRAQGYCSVYVDVEIFPGPECIVAQDEYDVTDLWIYRDEENFDCNAEVRPWGKSEDASVVFRGCRQGIETCTCTAFDDCDIVPHVRRVEDDSFVARLFVADSSCASHVFERLQDEATAAELLRYRPIGEPERSHPDISDASHDLTEKQRRALELAVHSGYYASPRECSLDLLAAEEDISVSAFAKRLRNAERTIFERMVGSG